jgi:hypothetical protein
MKKYRLILLLLLPIILNSCYNDTLNSLSSFKLQVPINFRSNFYNKAAPDSTFNFANLSIYKEFNDNVDRIKNAQIYQLTYWIDSLQLENKIPFNPKKDSLEFEFIRFYLTFAIPKPGHTAAEADSSAWMPDPDSPSYLIGEFNNVNISEYYRTPKKIISISEDVAAILSQAVKNKPQFYLLSEYGKTKGQKVPVRYFPLIFARYDLVIRLDVGI